MENNQTTLQPWYRKVSKDQWKTLFACWLGWALDAVDFIIITYVLTDIAKEFDLSLTTASTLILATFAVRWLGGAVIGSVADRLGRKKAMIIGVLIYSGATFLCGLSWDFWSLFVFRLLVGIGMAGEYTAGTTLLLESWPKELRNKASGFLCSGWAAGGLLASVLYGLIVPNFGWRALFFVGILPAFITLYMRWNVDESREWEEARQKKGNTRKSVSFFQLFSRQWFPILLLMTIFEFAFFGSQWPLLGLMPTYFKDIGYDAVAVSQLMFIANFGGLLGNIALGFVADRIGTRRTFVYTFLVGLVFVVLATMVGHTSIALLGILMFLVLFTIQGISGLCPKYLADHFDVEVRSAGLGVAYNVGAIAGGLSPVWGSALKEAVGLGNAIMILTIFWSLLVVIFVGLNIPKWVIKKRSVGGAIANDSKIG
ncbi:MFS transporter [Peribacillus cavernae]|uniref:MFS transporter n=1 Tax=Peribacillus cavernae TaxID=1674310 RepID=A0A3S0VXD4_9BACI|nr:MFS transporter [Peribacillus cavernae]MDQ0217693.1 SHS family sialic acid transporter-like MFS transporter [Peribacillus cavernae]RUQ28163.1 MFS transporter [Peribacillus cavernae]